MVDRLILMLGVVDDESRGCVDDDITCNSRFTAFFQSATLSKVAMTVA